MTSRLRRLFGLVIVLIAVVGIAFTGYVGYRVWIARPVVTTMLDSNIKLVKDIVSTSNDLLILVEDTLEIASDELDTLSESLLSLTNIMQDADPLLDSIQTLTGESLPATLEATQTSLETAQQSADIIDNLLRTISRIPFFPGDPYDPDVPLSESLSQISSSLDAITPAMLDIQSNLASTQENIAEIDTQLDNISSSTVQIQKNLADAQNTLDLYQSQMDEVQSRLTKSQLAIPGLVTRIASGIIFLLVWLGLAQIGLLFQGIQFLSVKEPAA